MSVFLNRIVAALGLLLMASAVDAIAFTGETLAREATVSLTHARGIAIKVCPGKILDEELEHEIGGSGLRYSFVIQQRKVKREVGMDAKTGELLENHLEGPHVD